MLHRSIVSPVLVALALICPGKEIPVPSTITNAKVFLSGAQVTRTAKLGLPVGNTTLVFARLSEELDPANIQVHGQGAFTILGVRHRLNSSDSSTTKQEVKTIEARIKSLAAEITREQAAVELLIKEEVRLAKNDLFGGDKGVSMEELQRMNEYIQRRIETISTSTITKQEHITALNEALNEQHRKLVEVRGRKPVPTSEVLVDVTCRTAVEARLTLTYLVRSAGWTPSYDIRVKDISQPLELVYKAQVFQSSGEDWSDVALALSSGEPKKGAVMPLLSTWLLDFGMPRVRSAAPPPYRPGVRDVRGFVRDERTGEALPFVNITVADEQGTTLNGTTTDFEGYYAIAIPENGKELRFNSVGYTSRTTPIGGGVINQDLSPGAELQEVLVTRYAVPMIDKDGGASGATITRDQLRNSPARTTVSVQGARAESSHYYIDGVKVASGDVPANYGDITGGLINVDRALADRAVRRAVNFEFNIEVPYSIPSDGQSHTVAVREERMKAGYKHYCTPKLDLDAFLFAKVTGWDTLNLLPGDARIYFEGTYVGESRLDPTTTGDTLDLSLGRDKAITVQRTKRKDFSQKQTVGGKRIDSVSWELAVRNNKAQPVQLVITDQFPVSVRSEIEVELAESSGAQVSEEKGLLTWKKSLEPRSNQTWNFGYSAKYPKEGLVVLE
ncbi:MAG: mucoidy inhibitor MuiA family protein [Flavobacteriales bacterium]|nr:mucoidy inhibitor MuiA family protein [Flavobacteriales bacterium]